jgi:hypothetical protein
MDGSGGRSPAFDFGGGPFTAFGFDVIFPCDECSVVAIAVSGASLVDADCGTVTVVLQAGHKTDLPANRSAAWTCLPQLGQVNCCIGLPFPCESRALLCLRFALAEGLRALARN